ACKRGPVRDGWPGRTFARRRGRVVRRRRLAWLWRCGVRRLDAALGGVSVVSFHVRAKGKDNQKAASSRRTPEYQRRGGRARQIRLVRSPPTRVDCPTLHAARMPLVGFREERAMCGIIGYVGGQEAEPLLVIALRRMEYHGY